MSHNAGAADSFKLGGQYTIRRVGYGAMRLTGQPGNHGPYADWEGGKRLLRRALELGVNFIDTAIAYGGGYGEAIVAEALAPYSPDLVIATKCGVNKLGPGEITVDGSPAGLRRNCEASLASLKTDCISLLQLHRVDPNVPLEESVGALARLREEGKIRHIGLSNVRPRQLRAALAIAPITSVQNRFNVAWRKSDRVLDFCGRHGIAFLPWSPLGGTPSEHGAPLSRDDGPLGAIARARGVKPGQVALAWALARSECVVPIPGTTRVEHLEENVAAAELRLTREEMVLLNALGRGTSDRRKGKRRKPRAAPG